MSCFRLLENPDRHCKLRAREQSRNFRSNPSFWRPGLLSGIFATGRICLCAVEQLAESCGLGTFPPQGLKIEGFSVAVAIRLAACLQLAPTFRRSRSRSTPGPVGLYRLTFSIRTRGMVQSPVLEVDFAVGLTFL